MLTDECGGPIVIARCSRTLRIAAAIALLAGAAALYAGQSGSTANQQAADIKEIHDCQLSIDKLTRFEGAAKAVKKIFTDNPAAEQKLGTDSQNSAGPNTIAQSAAAIDKQPQLSAAIKAAGFSTHEYVVVTYALMASEQYIAMKKNAPSTTMPADVSPANAAFAEANFDRIQILAQILMGSSN
jgi:hypothetical protein